jgi:hypothetical protein
VLDLSPSSEWDTTEGASSYPAAASSDGFLLSARSEPRATEEASSYLTEESEDGLTPSNSTEQQKAESVSPQQPGTSTNGFVPSDVSVAEEIDISDGLEISSIVVAHESSTFVWGTGVPEQLGRAVDEASPHLEERVTQGDVPSDADEIGSRLVPEFRHQSLLADHRLLYKEHAFL